MSTVVSSLTYASASSLKDVVMPKEHGSWSLAFEPIALGLLIAPSGGGGWLALALSAGFFARRPLRLSAHERQASRRAVAVTALMICALIALLSMTAAVWMGGTAWLGWLAPVAIAAAVFAHFDRKGAGREEAAEIAGSAAFALVPGAIAILGGLTPWQALAVALLSLSRSVPSVLCVRSFLRAKKTGVRRNRLALVASVLAVVTAGMLWAQRLIPFFGFAFMVMLALRAFALLLIFRPPLRARTLGMTEALLGVLFVAGVAIAWHA